MKILDGIIVLEDDGASFDSKNAATSLWKDGSEIKGFGKRYRVSILGRSPENAPSSSLPIADVLFPVTAGTGHDACYQTSNLKPGSRVKILEQDDGRLIIIGCIINNERVKLEVGQQPSNQTPFRTPGDVPVYNISQELSATLAASNTVYVRSLASEHQRIEGIKTTDLGASINCDKVPLGAIQIKIKNFIKDVSEMKLYLEKQKLKYPRPISVVTQPALSGAIAIGSSVTNPLSINSGLTTDFSGATTLGASTGNEHLFNDLPKPTTQNYSIDEWLNSKIQNVGKDVTKFLKDFINKIQTGLTNKINNLFKDLYYNLFPKQLQEVKEKVETFWDLVFCLFRKILGNLFKMVAKFLKSAIDYIINPATCIIENFVGGLLGKIISLITSGISALLQPINALLGVIDIGTSILSVVEDILTSLSCDESPSCPEIKEWSVWDGPVSTFSNSNINDVFNKIKQFSGNVQQSIDPNNFNFDLDFSDVFQSDCNIGAIACGPPIVSFFGGGGTGATGNAIVNSLGQVIGIDVTNAGRNYTSSPIVRINDACGNGSGAVARAIIGPVIPQSTTLTGNVLAPIATTPNAGIGSTSVGIGTTTTTGVQQIVIEDPGTGYLPVPDGSYGANGLTLTQPVKTTATDYPIGSDGTYPVIMKLCDVFIENGGVGYSQDDVITIEPSNGASVRPYYTATGSLYKIDILTKGEGFKELPTLTIVSKTGFNAKILPRLCAERVGDNLTITPTVDKIINVVDCPGR